eukprot:10315404-Karenia_brevis.AAC.1
MFWDRVEPKQPDQLMAAKLMLNKKTPTNRGEAASIVEQNCMVARGPSMTTKLLTLRRDNCREPIA